MSESGGRLTLVAGPIGTLGDLSPRAAETLTQADEWLVEDSRVSGRLQIHLGIKKKMSLVNEQTSEKKLQEIVEALAGGANLALLTDAGMPGISDPGARLVDICLDQGLAVDVMPGPSAVTTALALSGFFAQRFAFLGFLPRKRSAMAEVMAPFVDSTLTLVFFESPYRFRELLAACAETLGPRRYAVCREMTKMHQQVFRGELPMIPDEAQVPAKGEFTVVVEGRRRTPSGVLD